MKIETGQKKKSRLCFSLPMAVRSVFDRKLGPLQNVKHRYGESVLLVRCKIVGRSENYVKLFTQKMFAVVKSSRQNQASRAWSTLMLVAVSCVLALPSRTTRN